jgi:hypothetical protein
MVEKEFRNQHDMRKLVLSALCKDDKDAVVAALGEDVGIARIRELMQQRFRLDAGNRADRVSFQRVAVPLCALLSNGDVANCTRTTAARKLYVAADSVARFLPDYLAICEELLANNERLLDHVAADRTAYDPSSIGDVVEPLVGVVLQILAVLTDAPADEKWPPFLQRLSVVIAGLQCPEKQLRTIKSQFQRADSLVQRVLNEREARQIARAVFEDNENLRVAQSIAQEVEVPREVQPPPGELRDGGPRHDNDRVNFREIRVLPTAEEVLSRADSYLPLQRVGQPELASPFVASPVDRHLDVQFRLLREDMLAPVRRAVHAFIDSRPLVHASAHECHFARDVGQDRVSCAMFRNLAIASVAAHMNEGVSVVVEFDQHPDIATRETSGNRGKKAQKKSAAERERFWKDGRGDLLLQPDSLVIVVLNAPHFSRNDDNAADDADADEPQIVLATVLREGREFLGRDEHRCKSLQLHPLDNDLLTLIEQLGAKPHVDCEHVLLQVRGHFYVGFEPVLRALQRQDVARLPFLERIVPHYSAAVDNGPMQPPAFVNARTRFDLQCIATPTASVESRRALSSVAPTSYDALRALLHAHEAALVLDETQIDAFALALTREVALIQGPPGTGKTYVGVQIVRALLANSQGIATERWIAGERGVVDAEELERPSLEPILCVCYTNHALDQFLEHLVATGVVPLDRVVRVGGRSRSEMLAARTLHSLRRRSKAEWAQVDLLKARCNTAETRIETLRTACTRASPTEDWLRDFEHDLYAELYMSSGVDVDADDDFQVVGGFNAVLERWLRNGAAGERARRWKSVCASFVRDQLELLSDAIDEYNKLVAQVREIDDQTMLRTLRSAAIVAFTTSGAAKHDRLLHALRPRVVVCEEAGEVFEAHVLAALTSSAQSLILIGDHLQLRPKPSEFRLSVETGNGHDLDVSLFERLIASRAVDFCTLGTQRRMRTEIADLIRKPLYPQLRDHAVVRAYPAAPRGFEHPLWFLSHRELEKDDMSSKTNDWEAKMVVALVRYVVRQGYSMQQIAVLTPYVGQLKLLRARLRSSHIMLLLDDRDVEALDALDNGDDNDDDDDDNNNNENNSIASSVAAKSASLQERIRLATVDNFQGEEAEIVIVSTVRSNAQHRTGFLKVDNRVNVMLSRAKHGMIVLGSAETIKGSRRAKLVNAVVDQLTRTERIGPRLPLRCELHGASFLVGQPDEVPIDGGCTLPCGDRKACGHVCRRLCHPDDRAHRIPTCREQCMRLAPCGHACVRLCEEACECGELVDATCSACGFTRRLACSVARQPEAKWPPCPRVFADVPMPHCAHRRDVRCSERQRGALVCTALCGRTIAECGHDCERHCADCAPAPAAHAPQCEKRCERVLMCGHTCNVSPCHSADDCQPCGVPCRLMCEHSKCSRACRATCVSCAHACVWKCEHQACDLPCASLCERRLCDVRCARLLKCGHRCPSLCGEPCPAPNYCAECCAAPPTQLTLKTRDSVVDLVMHTTLAELDVSEAGNELLVLRCGHAFTRETLDGVCRIAHFYTGAGEPVLVAALAAIVNATPPRCPTCKVPVSGVRRYTRVMNWYALAAVQRKWQINVQLAAPPLGRDIAAAEAELMLRVVSSTATADDSLRQKIDSINRRVKQLLDDATQAPTRLVWERERALRLQRGDNTAPQLVTPLAVPLLIAREVSLRALQLQILSASRNFQPNNMKKKKRNNKKKNNKKKDDNDNDEQGAIADEPSAIVRQLQLLQTCWRDAHDEHAALVRECEESHSRVRLRDAHALYARLALVCAEEARALCDAAAATERDALRRLHDECVGAVEGMIAASHVSAAQFGDACKRAKSFAQQLTAEERRAIFNAMAPDIGSGHGSFGGHWFECPNGHVYTIGECGGAMQASRCPECGEVIGGGAHQLAAGNQVSREFASMQD